MANTVQTRQAEAAATKRSVGRPRGRYLRKQDGKLLIWTPIQAARPDTYECDRNGVALESPENDTKRINFLEKQIIEKDDRIYLLEQDLAEAHAALQIAKQAVTRAAPEPAGEPQLQPEPAAGIAPPPEPPIEELISPEAIQARRAAVKAQESQVLQLAPEPEVEEELEEVLPAVVNEPPGFLLNEEFARIEGSSNDAGEVKAALAAFAMERYNAQIDTRYTLDRLKLQIQDLEADRPKDG